MTDDEDRDPIGTPGPGTPEYGRVLRELGIECIAQDIPKWIPSIPIPGRD